MNNDQINQLVNGIGALTELWLFTYQQFKSHNLNDEEALQHTEAMMSVLVGSIIGRGSKEGTR